MNVSLPESQERFIRDLVSAGRYRSASEVVRDGLRMLEESEHRRLLEKLLYGELTDEERSSLPPDLLQRFRDRMDSVIAEARESANDEGWVGSDELRSRLNDRVDSAKRKHAG
jgi:putative addiction module CopG family antidote